MPHTHQNVGGYDYSFGLFGFFIAVAFSITAFPVLARIVCELRLTLTVVGSGALSAAAGDVCGGSFLYLLQHEV